MRACVIVALAIVAATIVESPSSSTASSSERACQASDLKIRLVRGFASLGTAGGFIGFTNRASAPCRLSGWPKLVAVTRAATATTTVRVRSTMFGPRPNIRGVPVVRLRHGDRADAVFTGSDIAAPGETTCPPPYRYLRVAAPGSSRNVLLSAWLGAYGHYMPSCTRIEVSMVVPASALYHG